MKQETNGGMGGRMRSEGKKLFIATFVLALGGFLLLGVKAVNTAAYDWMPVQVPLPEEPEQVASATFKAEVDAVYEVTMEYSSVLPEAQLRTLLTAVGEDAAADVSWTISQGDQGVAAGGSRTQMYHSSGGRSLLGKLRRYVLSIPFHRDEPSFVQVVGRFRATAGSLYQVSVERVALEPSLEATKPKLRLRLSREFWIQHSSGMLAFAYAGLALLALSAVIGLVSLFTLKRSKRAIG